MTNTIKIEFQWRLTYLLPDIKLELFSRFVFLLFLKSVNVLLYYSIITRLSALKFSSVFCLQLKRP